MDSNAVRADAEREPSWVFLHQGTPEQFIDALCADVLEHPAVHHPYLQKLASNELPDIGVAIRDCT